MRWPDSRLAYIVFVLSLLTLLVAASPSARADKTILVNPYCGDDSWTGQHGECNGPNGPKRTIRGAIEAAADGDVVRLTDGTYILTDNAMGMGAKNIRIESAGGAGRCIVDGQGRWRALLINNGQTNATIIKGITFRNCSNYLGGSIGIFGAAPTITDCVFIDSDGDRGPFGGAIYIDGAGIIGDRKTVIKDCIFTGNTVGQACEAFGGAIAVRNATVTIQRCVFNNNTVPNDSPSCTPGSLQADGGGVYLENGEATIIDCKFSSNAGQRGGAVFALNSITVIQRCEFTSNLARNNAPDRGGEGGAVASLGGSLRVSNSLFTGQTAVGSSVGGRGGALSASGALQLTNCTFVDNATDLWSEKSAGGAVVFSGVGAAVIENTVLWGNRSVQGNALAISDLSSSEIRYSLLEDGPSSIHGGMVWGPGNTSDNPRFVDPQADFRPDRNSPLIDAGDSNVIAQVSPPGTMFLDLNGNSRLLDDPGTPNTGIAPAGMNVVDIGCYEFQGSSCEADCDWSTGAGVLDIFDFLCFQNAFIAGHSSACDCDTSTGPGVCEIADYLCFQSAFAQGCQ